MGFVYPMVKAIKALSEGNGVDVFYDKGRGLACFMIRVVD